MAKGRRLTSSRSELLLGSYSYNHQGPERGGDAPELREDDVWSMVDGMVNGDDHHHHQQEFEPESRSAWSPNASTDSNGSLSNGNYRSHARPPPPIPDLHHNGHRKVGGLSLAFEDPNYKNTSSPRIVHQFRGGQQEVGGGLSPLPRGQRQMATSAPVNVPDWSKIYRVDSVESLHDSDDGADDPDSEWVPPHEYLAREYARSRQTAANSVFEGVGRTLKGRDLSRVRDAVWSQTGFDG
ncbi:OLC1v1021207C1 [Oldenlandia corymbosa var. corymbosa]|uniref:OLC1v1021207C1 n=1 Tax=Oldenlandia corymbosa var. corymbosa TaxID=529605 RepID=A0AAV1BXL3_OLDCO|nr:OLC1v1021207C1 [Oldenlandia corymbosa var. corymbosa]